MYNNVIHVLYYMYVYNVYKVLTVHTNGTQTNIQILYSL